MTIVIQNYSLFNAWNGCLRLGADYGNINVFPEAIYLTAQVKNTLRLRLQSHIQSVQSGGMVQKWIASTQFWYIFWYVVIKDTKIDKSYLSLEPGWMCKAIATEKEDCNIPVYCCVMLRCVCMCVWCLSLLSVAAGQTATPQIWFTVTPSVQVSLRETPNSRSTAKTQGCCSVVDVPRWPLRTVSACATTENQKSDETAGTADRGGGLLQLPSVKFIHRGLNQIYRVKGLHQIDWSVNVMQWLVCILQPCLLEIMCLHIRICQVTKRLYWTYLLN